VSQKELFTGGFDAKRQEDTGYSANMAISQKKEGKEMWGGEPFQKQGRFWGMGHLPRERQSKKKNLGNSTSS